MPDRLGAGSLARRFRAAFAMRWFGARVVEIKQISAIPARGMNAIRARHISEHASAMRWTSRLLRWPDGRRITVKDAGRECRRSRAFLRDIQGAACQQFNTVLAPGSNVYHYDHIHVVSDAPLSRRII